MLMVRVEKAAGTSFDGVFFIERLHLLPNRVAESNLTSALPQTCLMKGLALVCSDSRLGLNHKWCDAEPISFQSDGSLILLF